ncbi:FACT complex subunit-domain-containing protein [Dunaliella salina]|uniref:FACT complex subunit n=1 Tax=Dunaliella salina TaxID=3046 RepID=A0ABQ7GT98_DUNSA|nr:FACT complex subunit-domain-containing protein [Dunaliella salina]|eukprot:KAF5837808.1 FACT complex subunit-domain-containing protein [Dunaliella salina]
MGEEVKVDAALFGSRLGKLFKHWQEKKDELWAGSRAVVVVEGSSSDDLRYLKSLTLHLWLFGYELPDTILAFTPKEMHVLASQKKSEFVCFEEIQVKLKPDNCDIAYPPLIQSGGKYDLKAFKDAGQAHLLEKLSKSLGHGMGIEFRESNSALSTKQDESNRTLRAGQVYNVCLSLTGLEDPEAKDPRARVYAMQVADTVLVAEKDKNPEVTTHIAPKTLDKVSYSLNDGDGDDEGADGGAGAEEGEALAPRKALRSDNPNHKSAEVLRRERQEELIRAKNQETLNRLTAAKDGSAGEAASAGRKVSEVVSYHKLSDFPSTKDLVITVHKERESVLLPIYGVMVPFHVTTIKNVSHTPDGDHAHIRVTFNFGGAYEPFQRFAPNAVFLKELSFRSQDVKHAAKVVQDIKMMRSAVVLRDKERAERATLVAQEKLIQGKRVYKVPDVWIRPAPGGKGRKIPGTLEAHANGFRYLNPRHASEPVHVMYRNIRHAFFQPAESEMITILHFNLINPIMLGKCVCVCVCVCAEVMDVVQTLDGGRRNMYDPDEIEEEQRERDRRNKINSEFNSFVKRVQELWERDYSDLQLEFDIPFRELGFHGVPQKSTTFILPTVNCLVELTEMPFTVVSLADVEVINLERVGFNLKNFDMAIVFKDFSRDVLRIDAIPSKSLDTIKDWLNSVNIKYYESKLNLAWKPILKSIQEDPEGFVENGGWEFLNMDVSALALRW